MRMSNIMVGFLFTDHIFLDENCLFIIQPLVIVSDECNNPLGMESGKIADSDLTSSSAYDYGTGPHRGR